MLAKIEKIVVTALLVSAVLLLAGSYLIIWQRVEKLYELAKVNKEADLKIVSYNEHVIAYNETVSKRNTDLIAISNFALSMVCEIMYSSW